MDNKKMNQLKRRRRTLEKKLGTLVPLMRGSVVELSTTCGNKNCRCASGKKHKKLYYSVSTKGKTRLIYLGKSRERPARQYTDNYKALAYIVEEMTTINLELLKAHPAQKST